MSRRKPAGQIIAWPEPGEHWHRGDIIAVRGHVDRAAMVAAVAEQAPEIADAGLRLSDWTDHTLARAVPDGDRTRVWFYWPAGRGTFGATVAWLVPA